MNPVLVVTGHRELDPNWSNYTVPVTAPANYKDPEKIASYVKQKSESLMNDVYFNTGCLSRFTEIYISYTTGRSTEGFSRDSTYQSQCPLYHILENLSRCCYGNTPVYVVGEGAEYILRSLFREDCEESKVWKTIDKVFPDTYTMFSNMFDYISNGLAFGTTFYYRSLAQVLFTADERRLLNVNNWIDYSQTNPSDRNDYIIEMLVDNGIIPKDYFWLRAKIDD